MIDDKDNREINVDYSELSEREKKYSKLGSNYGGKIGEYSATGLPASGATYLAFQNPEVAGLIGAGGVVTTYIGYRKRDIVDNLTDIGGQVIGTMAGKTVDSIMDRLGLEEEPEEMLE